MARRYYDSEKIDNPASALGGILKTYTKMKNAENELKAKMVEERAKRDTNFMYDLMKMEKQDEYAKKRIDYRSQQREAAESNKISNEAQMLGSLRAKKRMLEGRGQSLSDTEQAQLDMLESKIYGKKTPKMNYNEALKDAINRKRSWEDIRMEYPAYADDIDKKRKAYTFIRKSPEFKRGTGTPLSAIKSYFSKQQAEINPKTMNVISNIKTEKDFGHFVGSESDYRDAGIDTDAIYEYFGRG